MSERASNREILSFEDGHGRMVTRDVHLTVDVRDFIGTAMYPMLVLAANRHLSVPDVERYLTRIEDAGAWGSYRPQTWLYKRRWLSTPPGSGPRPLTNADGKDDHARAIMRMNARLSARKLSAELKRHGIERGHE